MFIKKEKCKSDPPIFSFEAKNIFFSKSRVCPVIQFSGAVDNSSDFDGKTILLECENNEYVYISGLEIYKFKTNDQIIDRISLMGNNTISYCFAIGENYTYFIYHRYKLIENDDIEEGT